MAKEENPFLEEFLIEYGLHVDTHVRSTRTAIDDLLRRWKNPTDQTDLVDGGPQDVARSAIAWTESRIKDPASVVDKISRKPQDYPHGYSAPSILQMGDVLGARVVVYFPTDLAYIDELVKNSRSLVVTKPATAYYTAERLEALGLDDGEFDVRAKDSGYRSIHYYLEYSTPNSPSQIFELQVRTLVDHVWASVEHLLGYKPGRPIPGSVHKQFELLAGHLNIVDQHFDLLRDEVQEAQNLSKLSGSDILDFVTLPYALRRLGVPVPQGDVNAALKMLTSNGIATWEALERASKSHSRESLQNAYHEIFDSRARHFTILAMWALNETATRVSQSLGTIELVTLARAFADKYRAVS